MSGPRVARTSNTTGRELYDTFEPRAELNAVLEPQRILTLVELAVPNDARRAIDN